MWQKIEKTKYARVIQSSLLLISMMTSANVLRIKTVNFNVKQSDYHIQGFITWDYLSEGSGSISVREISDGYVYVDSLSIECNHPEQLSKQSNLHLVKLDIYGNKIWEKIFDYDGYNNDYSMDLEITSDGGFIVLGMHNTIPRTWFDVIWIVKTDKNGNIKWDRIFNFSSYGFRYVQPNCIKQIDFDRDGFKDGYIIIGETSFSPMHSTGIFIVKTDINGENEQIKFFFDNNPYTSLFGHDFIQLEDAGVIIVGELSQNSIKKTMDGTCLVLKLDSNLNYLNHCLIRDTGFANCIQPMDDGYIILTDSYLVKTNIDGHEIWKKNFGGNYFESTNDDGCIIVGTKTIRVIWGGTFSALDCIKLLKTDSEGNKKWETYFSTTNRIFYPKSEYPLDARGYHVQQTNDGGYIIAGLGGNETYFRGSWIIKTSGNPKSDVEPGLNKLLNKIFLQNAVK